MGAKVTVESKSKYKYKEKRTAQEVTKLLVARVSLIETRFFSPPLTPRIAASPTSVSLT
jgi:hypothetical protein